MTDISGFCRGSLIRIRAHHTISTAHVSVRSAFRKDREKPRGRNIYAPQLETCFRRVDLSVHARRVCDVDFRPIGTQAEEVRSAASGPGSQSARSADRPRTRSLARQAQRERPRAFGDVLDRDARHLYLVFLSRHRAPGLHGGVPPRDAHDPDQRRARSTSRGRHQSRQGERAVRRMDGVPGRPDGDVELRLRVALHGLRAEDRKSGGYRLRLSAAARRPNLAAPDRRRLDGRLCRLGRARRRASGDEAARMGPIDLEIRSHSWLKYFLFDLRRPQRRWLRLGTIRGPSNALSGLDVKVPDDTPYAPAALTFSELLEQGFKVIGRRGIEIQRFLIHRMFEAEAVCVQRLTPEFDPVWGRRLVNIFLFSHQRMAAQCRLNADLVAFAGDQRDFDQSRSGELFNRAVMADRLFGFPVAGFRALLSQIILIPRQKVAPFSSLRFRAPVNDGQVDALGAPALELIFQVSLRLGSLREYDDA